MSDVADASPPNCLRHRYARQTLHLPRVSDVRRQNAKTYRDLPENKAVLAKYKAVLAKSKAVLAEFKAVLVAMRVA